MNEEKNNIEVGNVGINNGGLPPMGTVPSGNVTNNIQDKYGLPPISNFTNFNNNYEAPKVDNNTSVFDLMDQFESVTNNNASINNEQVGSMNVSNVNSALNNEQQTNIPNIPVTPINNTNNVVTPSINIPAANENANNNYQNTPVINNQMGVNNTSIPVINNQKSVINNTPSIPVVNNTSNNVMPDIPILNQSVSNIDSVVNKINPEVSSAVDSHSNTSIPPFGMFSGNNNVDTSLNRDNNIVNTNNVVVNNSLKTNSLESFMNNDVSQSMVNHNDINLEKQTTEPPMVNLGIDNNTINNENSNNNQIIDIPTTSIDDIESNNNEVNDLITSFDNNASETAITNNNSNVDNKIDNLQNTNNVVNTINTDNNTNNVEKQEVKNVEKPKKKKKHKLLFIILLIVTILILTAVGVLSYFMFFKTDKLVCGLQNYSNEQFILDESMVIKFKGNKMTDAKLSQVLTFTEDNLDKKDSYLEELKNQYQGLGFNVSFVENEDGFEIDMDFTKSDLESWYGSNLKNSSKTQMKKELRNSGYTCK